jgi:DNA replication protein DnaC
MKRQRNLRESLAVLLRALRLPTFVAMFVETAEQAEKKGWSFEAYLNHLATAELEDRKQRRIERNLKRASFPEGKTLATLKLNKVPVKVRRQLPTLCEGGFVEKAENILAFGLPGRGKTHLLCAIGNELIQRGYKVLFIPAYHLVQQLLMAKRELILDKALQRLDRYDVVFVDDVPVAEVRASQRDDHQQLGLLAMGPHLQGPDDDGGRHRPRGAPRDHPGHDRAEHPQRGGR